MHSFNQCFLNFPAKYLCFAKQYLNYHFCLHDLYNKDKDNPYFILQYSILRLQWVNKNFLPKISNQRKQL